MHTGLSGSSQPCSRCLLGTGGVRCYARTWINAGSGRAAECQLQRSGLWRDCPPESGESPGHMGGKRAGEGAAGDLLFCSAGAWVATSALQLHALRRAKPAVKRMGAAGCAEAADAQPEKGRGHAAGVGSWIVPPRPRSRESAAPSRGLRSLYIRGANGPTRNCARCEHKMSAENGRTCRRLVAPDPPADPTDDWPRLSPDPGVPR